MRSSKAIFFKQMKDVMKNRMVLIQFILFPVMAFIMTELVAKSSDEIPNNMFLTMFAAMFAGMGPLVTTAGAIAEDREKKSLRFLVMAGVKPHEYLMGIGGFVLLVSSIVSVFFGLIGDFTAAELLKFILILIFGSLTSILLGAAIGIFSKNQQTATAISVPVFMILSMCPLIAQFNETAEKIAGILYTQQINAVVNDFSVSAVKPVLIILANLIVFVVLFILAYKKKGLKG
ncbi:MAG: ABC transporter permease [Oscillospiraceae bacterium]|nr:ABC transporter permease [Oscillospiraceae bacterium]